MRQLQCVIMAIVCLLVVGCANMAINPNKLPKGVTLNKDVVLPVDLDLTVYIPSRIFSGHYTPKYSTNRVEYGNAMHRGFQAVSNNFFPNLRYKQSNNNGKYGLFLDIDPDWNYQNNKINLTFDYKVLDSNAKVIYSNTQSFSENLSYQFQEDSFHNAAVRVTQLMYVDIVNNLKPNKSTFPTIGFVSKVPNAMLANFEQPVLIGTGFKLNNNGAVLTANSNVRHCLVVKIKDHDQLIDTHLLASSNLLDLAVLSTEKTFNDYLSLSEADLKLGQQVTTVSYNKKDNGSASSLSFGNINSLDGIQGSKGLYQFSAAIAPESKGGALLNSAGNVIGILNGDLNTEYLADTHHISKNVYFAMKNEYLRKFLELKSIPYSTAKTDPESDGVIEKAMTSILQVNCYQ